MTRYATDELHIESIHDTSKWNWDSTHVFCFKLVDDLNRMHGLINVIYHPDSGGYLDMGDPSFYKFGYSDENMTHLVDWTMRSVLYQIKQEMGPETTFKGWLWNDPFDDDYRFIRQFLISANIKFNTDNEFSLKLKDLSIPNAP